MTIKSLHFMRALSYLRFIASWVWYASAFNG
jgi:hypothetical protein